MSAGLPLIVLTNGRRDCLTRTLTSIDEHLTGFGDMTIVDDSGNDPHRRWLVATYPNTTITAPGIDPVGYWRAMRFVFELARMLDSDAIAFWEDDFVLNAPLDGGCLHTVLCQQPHLAQIALRRQPWWPNEIEHGGVIEALEARGHDFEDCSDGVHSWIEHRACFTGNPCLIPRRTFERDWPEGAWSESRFGRELFADPAARGAYWGRRGDPPLVEHIGYERVGLEY